MINEYGTLLHFNAISFKSKFSSVSCLLPQLKFRSWTDFNSHSWIQFWMMHNAVFFQAHVQVRKPWRMTVGQI